MKIIAFTAKKETGKTTAVKYMMQKYPDAVQINFKDALIEELKLYFPELLQAEIEALDKSHYDGMDAWTIEKLFKVKPPVIRALMRNFGTEVRRAEDQNYWVNKWQGAITLAEKSGVKIVFTDDLRFISEWEAVRNNNGLVIKINSDKSIPVDTHGSEAEMDLIVPDQIVQNFFGDVEVMYKQLDEITI